MTQHKRTWQKAEQRIAEALGTTRNGNTGHATADVGGRDTDHWLSVEVKSWKRPSACVESALTQAERAAGDGQLPVAVIHTLGRQSRNDLVVMRLGEFLEWFGDGRAGSDG